VVRISDVSQHCNTETCYWFAKGIAHIGACYDGRTPAKGKPTVPVSGAPSLVHGENRMIRLRLPIGITRDDG
jgi:hypothetical protein